MPPSNPPGGPAADPGERLLDVLLRASALKDNAAQRLGDARRSGRR
jgi:hypothetical protein